MNYLQNEQIDLLITDIKMPVIDGINLIKAIKNKNYKLNIVVLSGYSSYEILRETIKYGVMDYLLKPIDTMEFIQMINRIKSIDAKNKIIDSVSKSLINEIHDNSFAQKTSLLYNLVKNADFFKNFISDINFDAENVKESIIGIAISDGIHDSEDIETTLKQLNELLYNEFSILSFIDSGELVILFLFNDTVQSNISERIHEIQLFANKRLGDSINRTVSISCGVAVEKIVKLYSSYTAALKAKNQLFYLQEAKLIFYDDKKQYGKINDIDVGGKLKRIYEFAENADVSGINTILNSVFDECHMNNIKPNEVKDLCVVIFSNLMQKTKQRYTSSDDMIKKMLVASNYYNLKEYLSNEINDMFTDSNTKNIESLNVIDKSKEYIVNNFRNPINLKDVSNHVHLNPTYFSELFKKETGQNFMEFLIETRSNEAKRLLINEPNLFINEVGRRVGYPEPVSFNRAFKRVVGCTPINYRIRNRS